MKSPKNVPEPTDVRPTTKPQLAPIAIATSLSRRVSVNGPSVERPAMNVLAKNPRPPRIRAAPMILVIADCVPSENELASCTPTSEQGPDRSEEHTSELQS